MSEITFSVAGMACTIAVNDADVPRIMAYLASTEYGTVKVEGEEDRPATPQETAEAFAAGILRGLITQTVRYERDLAAKAAADAVAEIEVA